MRKINQIVVHCSATRLGTLKMGYPETQVVGHRDLSPDINGNREVEPMEWTK